MSRIKRAVSSHKKRRKVLKRTKGFEGIRSKTYRKAKEAMVKAEKYAYIDRRTKKRTMRSLWNVRINAGVRKHGLSYSKFINLLKKKDIKLNRKMLAKLAAESPQVFDKIVEKIKGGK